MEIIQEKHKAKGTDKPEMEQVEQEKVEYKLIGNFLRTRGLKLYSYAPSTGELKEVDIKYKETLNLVPDENGNLQPEESATEECTVDSRCEHFEALNWENAQKRIAKWKAGKIKELCNLREPGEGINYY